MMGCVSNTSIELHPLALEDVLANRGNARSKADYFTKHLALRILCHAVVPDEDAAPLVEEITKMPRSSSPDPMTDSDEKGEPDEDFTLYGGSAPGSKFSTTKVKRGSLMRRRGAATAKDLETSLPSQANTLFAKAFSRQKPVGVAYLSPILHFFDCD